MSAPINKKLPELTLAELTTVLKNATYRGYNVNNLATEIAKNGVANLKFDVITNQVGIVNSDGKLKCKIKLDKINGKDHSFSLTRFFKMHVFSCCFDQDQYDARVDRLAQELHSKIQEAEVKEQALAKLLSRKDFTLMKTILEKQASSTMVALYDKGVDAPKEILDVDFNKNTQSIVITGDNNKRLEFQLGETVTCLVDGNPTDLDKIPADRADWLMGSFKAAIELSSTYEFKNKKIEISALKKGIEKNPEAHLTQLSDSLKQAVKTKAHPRLNVILLKNDLTKGDGLDNGGISRDYLNSLFTSLIEDSNISFKAQKPSKLFMPVATQQGVSSNDPATLFPGLTDIEKRALNEMGRVMHFCYNSKDNTEDIKNNAYAIGQHFDDLLFEVALTLNANDAKANFEDLSVRVKADIAKRVMEKFLRADSTNSNDSIKDKLALFDLFTLNLGLGLLGANLNAAAEFAGDDFIDEDDGFSLDMNLVNANQQKFVNAVREKLLNEKLGTTTVAELIAPIHAIAQGLHSACKSDHDWNQIRGVNARAVNNKIQGSLDRDVVAASFQVVTKFNDTDGYEKDIPQKEIQELNKKTKWLMDWIKNPATDDADVRKFLVYTTGSNSLPSGQKITIQRQPVANPIPTGITCKPALLIASTPCGDEEAVNDKTEGAFLTMLKEQILNDKSFEINQD